MTGHISVLERYHIHIVLLLFSSSAVKVRKYKRKLQLILFIFILETLLLPLKFLKTVLCKKKTYKLLKVFLSSMFFFMIMISLSLK